MVGQAMVGRGPDNCCGPLPGRCVFSGFVGGGDVGLGD